VFLSEWHGASTTAPLDQSTTSLGHGFGGSVIDAAITTKAANSFTYGIADLINSQLSKGAGFSSVNTGFGSTSDLDEYNTGSISFVNFINGNSGGGSWAVAGASFKP
jgi:hypothetical protein